MQEEAESEGAAQPAMLDPITDLKLNQLDIVDMVRERQTLLQVFCISNASFDQLHQRLLTKS